ncbi:MAG: hypothetical protein QUS11_02780 [Candidatus Fermentibacter sp.]|nr:hypothetical protein [Candidatus Fermentibacter sp.]
MKIGIAVHSKSGVTLALAEAAAGRLRERGHEAAVLPLEPEGDVQPHQNDVRLKSTPDCQGFDAMLVGGPIWAFGMSPVALAFASGLGDMKGMKALPFVTMGFRWKLLGGSQGISALSRMLATAGATVLPGVIASAWASRSDAEKKAVIERIVALLEG